MIWQLAIIDTIDICDGPFTISPTKVHDLCDAYRRTDRDIKRMENPRFPLLLACKLMHHEIKDLDADYTFTFCHRTHVDIAFDELLRSKASCKSISKNIHHVRCHTATLSSIEVSLMRAMDLQLAQEEIVQFPDDQERFLRSSLTLTQGFETQLTVLASHGYVPERHEMTLGQVAVEYDVKGLRDKIWTKESFCEWRP